MEMINVLLFLVALLPRVGLAADTLIVPGSTANPKMATQFFLQDNSNKIYPAIMSFSTDGSSNVVSACTLPKQNEQITWLQTISSDISSNTDSQHADLVQIDTDLNVFASINHSDLSTLNGNVDVLLSTRASESTLSAFKNANHTDVTGTTSAVNAFATANHSDLGTVNSSIQATEPRKMQDGSGNPLTSSVVGSTRSLDTNVTQNVTPLDISTNGSLGALNATLPLAVHGTSGYLFQLLGSWSGTIVLEGSVDNANWYTLSFLNVGSGISGANLFTSTTVNGLYRVVTGSAVTKIRLRMSAYTSGSASAVINASAQHSTLLAVQTNPGNLLASIAGISQTTEPNAVANGSYGVQTLDPYLRMPHISEESIDSRWGIMFASTTGIISAGATAETPIALLVNPIGSGKNIRVNKIFFSGPTAGTDFDNFVCYVDPTITSNGTALGIIGKRQTNQNSTIASAFSLPTASAFGSGFFSMSMPVGATQSIDVGFTQWLEPNHKLMCTVKQKANGDTSSISIEWVEE